VVKVLFFGTPQIAVPFLDWLYQHEHVVGVVCQPDQPVGRGHEVTSPPVKEFAIINRIPVFQPAGPWTPDTTKTLKELGADLGIAVAYGRLMPEAVFMAPRLGTLNVHFSLLPKYRGAGPMQWALINGETETGVTTFWLEKEMDSGPIFRRDALTVEPADDALTLKEKLVALGVSQLEKVITDIAAGHIVKEPQKGAPSFAPMLKKENGKIDWKKNPAVMVNLVRGVVEWPVAFTTYQSFDGSRKTLKILRAEADATVPGHKAPGRILAAAKKTGIMVECGAGALLLKIVQPEGKKPMDAWAFWQGARLSVGDVFA
jgi:methionyl-tRNA formyltransferase